MTAVRLPRLKLFFDGGCRPNPGPIEIAVVVGGQSHILQDIDHGSSMDAEWLALIHALRIVQTLDTADVVLLGDCAAVINQANGAAKCRGTNILHFNRFQAVLAGSIAPRIRYIKRTQNLAGIALARLHGRG